MRVLVIEHEALIRMYATDILVTAGCTVIDASSASTGLVLARQWRFDAAVVDLGLPDSPCAPLLAALLEAQPWLGLVISTGRRQDDPEVASAQAAGGSQVMAVIGKPWSEDRLREAVLRAARMRPSLRLVPHGLDRCCMLGAG